MKVTLYSKYRRFRKFSREMNRESGSAKRESVFRPRYSNETIFL